jgi:hypothetical protein
VAGFASLQWKECPDTWHAPFRPAVSGEYFAWPLLRDLMPWQHSGVQLKRTWPIAPAEGTLERRWRGLLSRSGAERAEAFRNTGDREVDGIYRLALAREADPTPISQLDRSASVPPVMRYAYRSLDRQFIIADGRLISRPRPSLWAAHGDKQTYLTSLLSKPLGAGPAVMACADMPDLDCFRGRGAKDIIPLYRDRAARHANTLPGLPELLAEAYGRRVTAEDLVAYVYGVLAQPAFTARFGEELGTRELRVPLTKDARLFEDVCQVGAKLLWLHTYGERYVSEERRRGFVPQGMARCVVAVPGTADLYPAKYVYDAPTETLHVGLGQFGPVSPAVYEFQVSTLRVVQSWLGYRMREPKGRRSSPLDSINVERWPAELTTELLELLWVLEATVEGYTEQAELLETVVAGRCFTGDELPAVPDAARRAPKRPRRDGGLFANE